MAYLNLDPAYFTHRKTLRLVARLGPGAEVLPIKLWAYCASYHPKDGALLDYTEAELGALLGHEQALQALIAVGFLDVSEGGNGWVCHDWKDHQGHLAAFKERAERAAKARWNKARKLKDASSNAPSIAPSNAPTIPNQPNQPNQQDKPTTAPRKRGGSPDEIEIPAELQAHETPIREWLAYKRERNQGYKPKGLNALWATCRKLGTGLPAAIEHSMASNYAGIYPAKDAPAALNKVSAKYQRGDDAYGD